MELEYDNDLDPRAGRVKILGTQLLLESQKPRLPADVCACSFKESKCCAGAGVLSRLWGDATQNRLTQGKVGRVNCVGDPLKAMAALTEVYGVTLKEAGSRVPGAKMEGQCAVQGPQLVII